MIECKICGKECKNNIGLSVHLRYNHEISSKDYFVKYLNGGVTPVCYCGKETGFLDMRRGFKQFCSNKCSTNSKETKEKRKQTCKKRFGTEHPLQNKKSREKYKQTCLERFGEENPSKAKKVKQKKIETCRKNYNKENPSQVTEIKEKKKQTCLKNHGAEYFLQTEEGREKYKQTCQEIYGTDSPMQNEEVQEKMQKTRKKNYLGDLVTIGRLKDKIELLINIDEYNGVDHYNKYLCKCVVCGTEFKDNIDNGRIPRCPTCFPWNGTSILEKQIAEEIQDYLLNKFGKLIYIKRNDRKILNGKEIDILIPELQISIEVNGDYWHGSEKMEKQDIKKAKRLIKKGYKHFVIREFEWNQIRDYTFEKLEKILEINFETYQENQSYFTGFYL
jgi:hypothetical protein